MCCRLDDAELVGTFLVVLACHALAYSCQKAVFTHEYHAWQSDSAVLLQPSIVVLAVLLEGAVDIEACTKSTGPRVLIGIEGQIGRREGLRLACDFIVEVSETADLIATQTGGASSSSSKEEANREDLKPTRSPRDPSRELPASPGQNGIESEKGRRNPCSSHRLSSQVKDTSKELVRMS